MAAVDGVRDALSCAVRESALQPEAIAARLGVSYNYLMRMTASGGSGCAFPLRYFQGLMRATKDYSPLRVLCNELGFMAVSFPLPGLDTGREMVDFQKGFLQLVLDMIDVFEGRGGDVADVLRRLARHQETAEMLKIVLKRRL